MTEREYVDGELLAEVPRGERDVYRLRLCEFKGHRYLDLRSWFPDRATGELRPGKGVTLKLTALPQIIEALQKAAQMVKTG